MQDEDGHDNMRAKVHFAGIWMVFARNGIVCQVLWYLEDSDWSLCKEVKVEEFDLSCAGPIWRRNFGKCLEMESTVLCVVPNHFPFLPALSGILIQLKHVHIAQED